MQAAVKEVICEQCQERVVIDFATAKFSTRLAHINGQREEKRIFHTQCTSCENIVSIESVEKAEWGGRKGPSMKGVLFGLALSCTGILLVGAFVLYFAGQGIMTVIDWLTK